MSMYVLAVVSMIGIKNKFPKKAIIFGLLFLLTYLFQDFLWEKMWILSFFLMALFALIFIIIFVDGFLKKDKRIILIFIGVLFVISITELFKSEIFKSEIVLQATLHDDLSGINLTLRKNNTFEVGAATAFSYQSFKGRYKLINDKIIFLDKPYENDFIPDTVTIYKDKIFLRFDKNNKPISDFATYFKIDQNQLKNSR